MCQMEMMGVSNGWSSRDEGVSTEGQWVCQVGTYV